MRGFPSLSLFCFIFVLDPYSEEHPVLCLDKYQEILYTIPCSHSHPCYYAMFSWQLYRSNVTIPFSIVGGKIDVCGKCYMNTFNTQAAMRNQ